MKKILPIIYLLLCITSCMGTSTTTGAPENVPPTITQAHLGKTLLIDVRSLEEYQKVHIKNSLLIPLDQLDSKIDDIKKKQNGDLSKEIVVHCRSGGRAQKAKEILEDNGFTNVINAGGVNDWPYKEDLVHGE